MTQLILHGPAISASRKKLIELKQKFDPSSVVVFESGTDTQTILGYLVTPSLFSDQRLIILENPVADLVLDLSLIASHLSLIIWFDHEVDTKKWSGFESNFFPESKEVSIFTFLDYLAAGDKRAFLEIEKLKKAKLDIHYCLTMVFYLLRNLAVTPKGAPDFVKRKLAKQRANFKIEDIQHLYQDILETDFKLKSGLLEQSQAEFLLVNKFVK